MTTLKQSHATLLAALKKVEYVLDPEIDEKFCACCEKFQTSGHDKWCELNHAIQQAEALNAQPEVQDGAIQKPIAYCHLTVDGEIRMWSKAAPESIKEAIGCDPTPLYTHPALAQPKEVCEWKSIETALKGETEKNASRYLWLRDKSVPPHNFYLSVPSEFHEIKYSAKEVDDYIDAVILGLERWNHEQQTNERRSDD